MTIVYKYNYNLNCFYDENDISYYLLGAFITDGCVYKNNKNTHACQLSSVDKDWLDSIKNTIGTNLKLHNFKGNYYGIRIIRNDIANWFIDHGCTPRKTYTVELPNIPDQYFPDFLRGCIDGDGSIGAYNNCKTSVCRLISASEKFLIQIQEKLNNLYQITSHIVNRGKKDGGTVNGKVIKSNVNSYSLSIYGKNCFKFLKLVYYPEAKLYLNRKNIIAQEIIKYYNTERPKYNKFDKFCKIQWPSNNDLIKMINNSNIEKVAEELNIHSSSIRNRLKRRKLYSEVKKCQKKFLPEDNVLIPLLKEKSLQELSVHLNIGYKTLRKKLKERNLLEI